MTDVEPAWKEGPSPSASEAAGGRRVVLGILLWGILALLTVWGTSPPAPLDADAATVEASGGRALEVLERLARGGVDAGQVSPPRPIGSVANARCAERILDELRRIGMRPEVQEVFGASARFSCAGTVRNIVCRLRGQDTFERDVDATGDRQAILCMAHYDSVGAGPGVGDDLAGVAAWIEVARTLKAGGPLERDVIFLFEDGEEHGLLGAELFAAQHVWASDVGAVINLEGRGTSGPSRLFETGSGNEWILRAFRAEASAPSATSVSSEIYKRMPNDTDYTVWRDRGVPGLNFAFIGGVNRYHTPLDNLANLSKASLQHHVTNGLQAVRALAASPGLQQATAGVNDAVFFDVLGRYLVLYQVRTARIIGVLLLIGALLAAARAIRAGAARPLYIVMSFGAVAVVLATGFFGAQGGGWVFGLFGVQAGVAHPAHFGPVLIGLLAAAATGVTLGAYIVGRSLRASEMGAAVGLILSALGIATTWVAPGISFLFAVPAAVLVLGGLMLRLRSDVDARWARVGLVALVVSTVLVLTPIHGGLLGAFGVKRPGVAVAPMLLGSLLLLPSLMGAGRSAALWVAGVGAIAAALAGLILSRLDPHTSIEPGHLNLLHVQQDGDARWQLQGGSDAVDAALLVHLTGSLSSDGGEGAGDVPPTGIPWSRRPLASAPAPVTGDAPPSLVILGETQLDDDWVMVRARAIPGRPSDQLGISLKKAGRAVIGGVTMSERTFRILGPEDAGVEFSFSHKVDAEVSVELWSQQFGLRGVRGRAAESYLASLPAEFVPFADGDGSLVQSTVDLSEAERLPVTR
ncbi:MAG: hypothetical protein ACI80K_003867 [Paracoccaceae bacterium]|jgi:hypothetical protein